MRPSISWSHPIAAEWIRAVLLTCCKVLPLSKYPKSGLISVIKASGAHALRSSLLINIEIFESTNCEQDPSWLFKYKSTAQLGSGPILGSGNLTCSICRRAGFMWLMFSLLLFFFFGFFPTSKTKWKIETFECDTLTSSIFIVLVEHNETWINTWAWKWTHYELNISLIRCLDKSRVIFLWKMLARVLT